MSKSLKSYIRITLPCLNLVPAGSLAVDGSGEALMTTQRSACWLVSWCLIMWTVTSSWRRAAHHHLIATAPVYLADHKILASLRLRSNICWVRQLPLLVSVSRRCRDPSGVTWFSSAQILTLLSKFSCVYTHGHRYILLFTVSYFFMVLESHSYGSWCSVTSQKTKILNHNL